MSAPIVKAEYVSLRTLAPGEHHLFMRVEGVDMRVQVSQNELDVLAVTCTRAAILGREDKKS